MAESESSPKSIEVGYELSDLEPKNIAIFALILSVTIVVVILVTYWLAQHFHEAQVSEPAISYPQGREPVPRPRFWVTPEEQLKAMRAEEDKILQSYGWADKQKGIARIPIEQAMELLAEKNSGQKAAAKTKEGEN
jgi:hypothetical protein